MADERVPDISTARSPPRHKFDYTVLDTIDEPIGAGGQAVVYQATISDDTVENRVAVKEPINTGTLDNEIVERFLYEAETWEMVDRRNREKPRWENSEHIVGIIDIGDSLPWIAMEYMDGGNLGDRLDDNPKGLPIDEALWIGECICNGLEVAHNYGVAHLDLKPANILFKKTADSVWDVPKIGDWGLARVLAEETGTLDGLSVKYAAPEHFESDEFGDPDTLTDIYQVGAIVYSLLAGQPPYTGSQTSIIYDIVHGNEVPRPSSVRNKLTNTVDMVVQKALSRNKKDRYRNITQFEEALRSIRTDQQPSLNVNQTEYLQEGNSNHSLVDDIKKDSKTTEAGSKGSDAKSINTSAKAEGEYIEMELIGFDKKYIDFEDRDNDLFEQKKYTVIALHVKNNTSNVWEFHGHMDLSVTSTEGFSHSTLQENGWSSRSGQFAPWNNATRPEIKPESKSRIVIILKSWFDLSKIEYTPRPSFSHQGDVDYEGRERLSIELNKELREELNSLPESLPIEDVVLN